MLACGQARSIISYDFCRCPQKGSCKGTRLQCCCSSFFPAPAHSPLNLANIEGARPGSYRLLLSRLVRMCACSLPQSCSQTSAKYPSFDSFVLPLPQPEYHIIRTCTSSTTHPHSYAFARKCVLLDSTVKLHVGRSRKSARSSAAR